MDSPCTTFSAVILLATLTACGGDSPPTAPEPTPTNTSAVDPVRARAEAAAMVANDLAAPGADSAAVYSRFSTSADAFEAELFAIAADPALSRAYLAARK